jgi:hypothetical protein
MVLVIYSTHSQLVNQACLSHIKALELLKLCVPSAPSGQSPWLIKTAEDIAKIALLLTPIPSDRAGKQYVAQQDDEAAGSSTTTTATKKGKSGAEKRKAQTERNTISQVGQVVECVRASESNVAMLARESWW